MTQQGAMPERASQDRGAQITIVGLGPGSLGDLTLEAWRLIETAETVWLRTLHHPVVAELPDTVVLESFDPIYEQADTFADVYAEIATRILALAQRDGSVIYAVPGHPLIGEASVTQILAAAQAEGLTVQIVDGLSFVEPALTALGWDALDGLQIFDALDMLSLHHPPLNPDYPALIGQVYSRAVASQLKLVLMNQYADEHPTVLIDAAGTPREQIKELPLYEIDRHEVSMLSSLFVTPLNGVTSFEGFQETIARLRSPGGCPWDREQTHQTLRTNLLEEAYEVLEAIDEDDPEALCEELGDLLLQVVLHAQIAIEEGDFWMTDVIAHIDAKLKRRHPHVWGEIDVENVGEVVTNWEVIKRRERAERGAEDRSLLDGIPKGLPALAQAAAYADRAARVGFDRIEPAGIWVELPGALSEQIEGVAAMLATDISGDPRKVDTEAAKLLGDSLLALADWARRHDVDPESALREANQRFAERFRILERMAHERDISMDEFSEDEVKHLWRDQLADE